jgi:hypothetical protein
VIVRIPRSVTRWTPSTSGFLAIIVLLLSLLVLSYSLHRRFDHDEFEHIHSAWYVANGYTPYSDFFQNHHPLLWYCMAPVLLVLGYSTQTVLVLRMAMFGLTMGIVFLTFLISRRVTSSTTASLLSVLLLLSMVMFLDKSIEIRPDVPQVLMGLVSVYFFVSFLRSQKNLHIVLAGVSASFSFIFLQKAVFLLLGYAALLLYGLLTTRISFRSTVYFVVSFSLPTALFLGHVATSGSLTDYVVSVWLVNINWSDTFSPLLYPSRSFVTQNALFWLLSPVSVAFILLNRKTSSALKVTAFIGIALLSSVLLVKVPFRQNFMSAIPLLCIATGYLIERVVGRFALGGVQLFVLVSVVLFQPLLFLAPRSTTSELRDEQLARVDFVLDNSADSDLVYDGNIKFNLYRPDLHYFWLSVGENKGLEAYNAVTNNKYGDYDGCRLVRSKRPTFISTYDLDITACGLQALYDQTPYKRLYMLRELDGVEYPVWRDFGGVASLLGYAVDEVREDGEPRMKVSLYWLALAQADADYTIFVHLVGPGDTILAQVDTLLQLGGRTTSNWKVGQQALAEYQLPMPAGLLTEGPSLTVGVYYWETGERLPVWDESGLRVPEDAVVLGPTSLED